MADNKEIVDSLEDMLGISSNENEDTSTTEDKDTSTTEDKDTSTTEDKDTSTTETNNQIDINKEVAKIEIKLEELQNNNSVELDDFYDNLDEYLSDEEQELEFENKKEYIKLLREKEDEYIKSNSKDSEIETLQNQKKEYENQLLKDEAISQTVSKYPDFNYDKAMKFFEDKLSKSEQNDIFSKSKSYADVYENTYKKMGGKTVSSKKAPNIPDVNNTRKDSANNQDVNDAMSDEEREFKEALGLI